MIWITIPIILVFLQNLSFYFYLCLDIYLCFNIITNLQNKYKKICMYCCSIIYIALTEKEQLQRNVSQST